MLVLNRRCNESIVIGTNIIVTVLSIDDGHVRLGITAPREVVVDRAEIYARKRLESLLALTTNSVRSGTGKTGEVANVSIDPCRRPAG
jgi:carbon storage regulator